MIESIVERYESGHLSTRDLLKELGEVASRLLSSEQRGLWVLQRMEPEMCAYNVPLALRCTSVDADSVRHAYRALVGRYPHLGASVRENNGQPEFCFRNPEDVDVTRVPMAQVSDESVADRFREEVRKPFRLRDEPMSRMLLVERDDGPSYLLLVAHHIVLDGSSTGLVLRAFLEFYSDCVLGRASAPPDDTPFSDFVECETAYLEGNQAADDRRFWREYLTDSGPLTGMPTLGHLSVDDPHLGEVYSAGSDNETTARIRNWLATLGVSEGVFYLAAFQILLHRYSGQDDIVIGMPVTNRPEERFDCTVGHLVNLLPVRSRFDPSTSFSNFIEGVSTDILELISHGKFPFSQIVRDRGSMASEPRSPIFQVCYNYQSFSVFSEFDGLQTRFCEALEFEAFDEVLQSGEYDLTLEIRPGDSIRFDWKYHPNAFSRTTVAALARHFAHLVESIVDSQGSEAVGRLAMLTQSERLELTDIPNRTEVSYPRNETCLDAIRRHAEARPGAPALTDSQRSLTYAALYGESCARAAALQRMGVSAGDVVGIHLERSVDVYSSVLAINLCRAAYVPLDPGLPPERISEIIADSGCRVVICRQQHHDQLTSLDVGEPRTLQLLIAERGVPKESGELAAQKTPTPDLPTADDLAYVIYTSGTTGKPKGVEVPHLGVLNYMLDMNERLELTPADRFVAVAPYAFDMSVMDLYLPLVAGAQCWIADSETIRDASRLVELLEEVQFTAMVATPATWNMLFRVGWTNERDVKIYTGGDALGEELRQQLVANGSRAWNLYGPTETTVTSVVKRLQPDEPVIVGTPIANTQVYVVDKFMEPVPVGVLGELCISGDGVARGYRGRPELTAEKFVDNPFRKGSKLYRTGDRARWLPSGEIALYERIDNQVKLRGYRIELTEIETILSTYSGVRDCVAVIQSAPGGDRLVAYLTADAGSDEPSFERKHLRDFLARKLPEHCIPSDFVQLASIPLTANGKVDRRKLSQRAPKTDNSQANASGIVRPPAAVDMDSSWIDAKVEEIFAASLGRRDFGLQDGFFDLGGNSISAIAVIDRINQEFSCELKVTTLFRCPSVATMADFLRTQSVPRSSKPVAALAKNRSSTRTASKGTPPDRSRVVPRDSLAIVGISCAFPGANDLHAYWQNLAEGRDSIGLWSDAELRRMGVPDQLLTNRNYIANHAELPDKAQFDAEFFNLSPRDAELIDPQGRLLLTHSWNAMEDAGYRPEHAANTSVFMSASNNFYHALLPGLTRSLTGVRVMDVAEEYQAWMMAQGGSIPTLISHKLGLTGPSFFVNTTCSSGLSGLYLACRGLITGEADYALVGASSIVPATSVGYVHQPGLNFSSNGRCKTFDDNADGMVGSEGVGVVLVRRAEDAVADGDHIYCFIRDVAVNNDGADKAGFFAPSVRGQSEVIRRVYENTGVNPSSLSFVEAHGTGTKIGDPIELSALADAFGQFTERKGYCAIGSVKSNIGHTDCAAGMAGLIKCALSLHHGKFPQTLHAQVENRGFDWPASPFYIARDSVRLDDDGAVPHRGALSSFGIGGTNVHALLEQAKPPLVASPRKQSRAAHRVDRARRTELVPLSARSHSQLRQMAVNLAERLPGLVDEGASLEDLAHTLRVGRRTFQHRIAFIVDGLDELRRQLHSFAQGQLPQGALEGIANERGNTLLRLFERSPELAQLQSAWLGNGDWAQLASLWVGGVELDWSRCSTQRHARISLPTYPFLHAEHWIVPPEQIPSYADVVEARRGTPSIPTPHDTASPLPQKRPQVSADHDTPQPSLAEWVGLVTLNGLAQALKSPPETIDREGAFADYGLTSLSAVAMVQRLSDTLGVDVEVNLVFDHPSVDRLATHLLESHEPSQFTKFPQKGSASAVRIEHTESPEPPDARSMPRMDADNDDAIAVVGMSGRFPGANDVDEFWAKLREGSDLVTPVTRWDLSSLGGKCGAGGFLDDLAGFDPLFFKISGLEAKYMEPQQRLFLEESWKALEDAGYGGSSGLDRKHCGVYVGCAAGDYLDLTTPGDHPPQALWGNSNALVPSRIAYFLDLQGPALAVDTACSSSLVAIHLACKALRSGECNVALAGGVFVQCSPRLYIGGVRAGMLSPTGHCHSFDARADGFVPAEGVGTLVLERLSDAIANGSHIYGVIRGTGINQDGTTNGITAPSARSQQDLVHRVYEGSQIDPRSIQLVEAHGTGTSLGDPLEFQALTSAFRRFTGDTGYCSLGSSKANLGHAQMAAGVIGIIKVLQALKHRELPPLANFETPNKSIDLEQSPFYVHSDLRPWDVEPGQPRRCCVTSLGASGTNAHIVIEEAPPNEAPQQQARPELIGLSAQSDAALRDLVERMHARCANDPKLRLVDVSNTLLLGRRHFAQRAAWMCTSVDDMVAQWAQWLRAPAAPQGSLGGSEHPSGTEIQQLAEAYLTGEKPDFSSLFAGRRTFRVSLPTYAFDHTSHWVDTPSNSYALGSQQVSTTPASTTPGRDRVTLTGEEYFLRDHQIQGAAVLPGSMYLELAQVAYPPKETTVDCERALVRLENIVFMRPLQMENSSVEVRTELSPAGEGMKFRVCTGASGAAGEPDVHCQGEIRRSVVQDQQRDSERLNIEAMLAGFVALKTSVEQFYIEAKELGVAYGDSFQGCRQVYTAPGSVIARLEVPDVISDTASAHLLHPVIMDSAMQCMRVLAAPGEAEAAVRLLFAIKSVQVLSACPRAVWAWMRFAEGDKGSDKIDVDLVDDEGQICVEIRGISARKIAVQPPAEPSPAVALVPVWDTVERAEDSGWPCPEETVVAIVGGCETARNLLGQLYPKSHVLVLDPSEEVEDIAEKLRAIPEIEHLFWLSPQAAKGELSVEGVISNQSAGTLEVFRIIKALHSEGYSRKPLGLTFITHAAHSMHERSPADPTHAGVAGLVGSLAKEQPKWRIRSVDLENYDEASLRAIAELPASRDGNVHLYRRSQWLSQQLVQVKSPLETNPRIRQGGVFVIVGGAGGLGSSLTRHLAQHYGVQVVWLGRRAADEGIEGAVRAIASVGPAPAYIQADATDPEALRRAHEEIKTRFGCVHGVVHAGLVLFGATVAKMEESDFSSVFRGKVDVSTLLLQEFAGPELELALLFSSINSYLMALGQSNYSAGCTFMDSWAIYAARSYRTAVKVINLGYCFNNADRDAGAPAGAQQMAFIDEDEFLAGIESLIAGERVQTTFMKFSPALNTRGMSFAAEWAMLTERATPSTGTDHVDVDDRQQFASKLLDTRGKMAALIELTI